MDLHSILFSSHIIFCVKYFWSRRNHVPETHVRLSCHLHPSSKKAEKVLGSADESDGQWDRETEVYGRVTLPQLRRLRLEHEADKKKIMVTR